MCWSHFRMDTSIHTKPTKNNAQLPMYIYPALCPILTILLCKILVLGSTAATYDADLMLLDLYFFIMCQTVKWKRRLTIDISIHTYIQWYIYIVLLKVTDSIGKIKKWSCMQKPNVTSAKCSRFFLMSYPENLYCLACIRWLSVTWWLFWMVVCWWMTQNIRTGPKWCLVGHSHSSAAWRC